MADKKTHALAKVINNQLGEPFISQLYDCLRTEVYGLPGRGSIRAKDLVHELARILQKPDPSSDAD